MDGRWPYAAQLADSEFQFTTKLGRNAYFVIGAHYPDTLSVRKWGVGSSFAARDDPASERLVVARRIMERNPALMAKQMYSARCTSRRTAPVGELISLYCRTTIRGRFEAVCVF